MNTHNIYLYGEIRKILCGYPPPNWSSVLPVHVYEIMQEACLSKAGTINRIID